MVKRVNDPRGHEAIDVLPGTCCDSPGARRLQSPLRRRANQTLDGFHFHAGDSRAFNLVDGPDDWCIDDHEHTRHRRRRGSCGSGESVGHLGAGFL